MSEAMHACMGLQRSDSPPTGQMEANGATAMRGSFVMIVWGGAGKTVKTGPLTMLWRYALSLLDN
jgi:hypothetical protein